MNIEIGTPVPLHLPAGAGQEVSVPPLRPGTIGRLVLETGDDGGEPVRLTIVVPGTEEGRDQRIRVHCHHRRMEGRTVTATCKHWGTDA